MKQPVYAGSIGLFLVLLLVIFSWLPQMLTLNPGISYGDEGFIANGAIRVANGEIPCRDFFSNVPGAFYWTAAFLKVLGNTFFALRLSTLATAIIILLSSFIVLRRLGVRSWWGFGMLFSYLAFFGGPYWFVASHHWLSLAFCLLSLMLLLYPEETRQKARDSQW